MFYFILKAQEELKIDHPVFNLIVRIKEALLITEKLIRKSNEEKLKKKIRKEDLFLDTINEKCKSHLKKFNVYENDYLPESMEFRKISQIIWKNKGLIRYRKRQISKLKLRWKFEQAQKKLKTMGVRRWKSLPLVYKGQSNINSNILRSLQL